MGEFSHDFDFFECLIAFEGVYLDAFKCKRFVFVIFDKINASKAALANSLNRLVVLHKEESFL